MEEPKTPHGQNSRPGTTDIRHIRQLASFKGNDLLSQAESRGIRRAVAVPFAMDGATSVITYLPEEESDAKETKRHVEELGQYMRLLTVDLRD